MEEGVQTGGPREKACMGRLTWLRRRPFSSGITAMALLSLVLTVIGGAQVTQAAPAIAAEGSGCQLNSAN